MSIETRVTKLEAETAEPTRKYYRLWNFYTMEPHRRLTCFVYPGPSGLQEEISEEEFRAACPDATPNYELERQCGQRDDEEAPE